VCGWAKSVGDFAGDAMQFVAQVNGFAADSDWKSGLRRVSDRAPPLQRQGCHFLQTAQHQMPELEKTTAPWSVSEQAVQSDAGSADEVDLEDLRGFWQRLEDATRNQTFMGTHAEERSPGILRFVHNTFLITEAIPDLRIPTNGFLFEIALSLYLDECKSRGRKKRGGNGVSTDFNSGCERHPLEADEDLESVSGLGNEEDRAETDLPTQVSGPELSYEDEEFLEKFYAYLHRPVELAESAYAGAVTPGGQRAARKRLQAVVDKFSRLTGVLSLLGEGYTQDAIAERLTISRNQVKYVVETVQESYLQFCSRTAALAQPQAAEAEESSHVK